MHRRCFYEENNDWKLKIPLMLSLFLFLLLIKFEFAIFLWPLITLIYGWFSENRTSSLILGILPYIFSFLYIVLILGALYMSDEPRLIELTIYWMILSLIGGTIGYLAAWKTRMSLMLAIGFLILWNVVVYSGLDWYSAETSKRNNDDKIIFPADNL